MTQRDAQGFVFRAERTKGIRFGTLFGAEVPVIRATLLEMNGLCRGIHFLQKETVMGAVFFGGVFHAVVPTNG